MQAWNSENDKIFISENSSDPLQYLEIFKRFIDVELVSSEVKTKATLLGSMLFDMIEHSGRFSLDADAKKKIVSSVHEILSLVHEQGVKKDQDSDQNDKHTLRQYFVKKREQKTIFEAKNISKVFYDFELKNLSFELKTGQITCVVGENGSGKSSLLKIVAARLSPSGGTCEYPAFSAMREDWPTISMKIGYIPQKIETWTSSTVKEQLHFTASAKGIYGKENLECVEYVIVRMGLDKIVNKKFRNLSGGFQLRAAIANELVWSPKLLVLDEPLANLDIKAQTSLLEDLRNLTNSLSDPMSVIISSQNIYDVEKVADNLIFLHDGDLKYNGLISEISKFTNFKCIIIEDDSNTMDLYNYFVTQQIPILQIRDLGFSKIILIPHDVEISKVLQSLLNSNIEIKYFRNISESTRVFFENIDSI